MSDLKFLRKDYVTRTLYIFGEHLPGDAVIKNCTKSRLGVPSANYEHSSLTDESESTKFFVISPPV